MHLSSTRKNTDFIRYIPTLNGIYVIIYAEVNNYKYF